MAADPLAIDEDLRRGVGPVLLLESVVSSRVLRW